MLFDGEVLAHRDGKVLRFFELQHRLGRKVVDEQLRKDVPVALVIFARWDPVLCFFAALLFGGAGALGPALQSVGITWGYYLFNAAPYVLTLLIMIATSSTRRTLIGAPGELSVTK